MRLKRLHPPRRLVGVVLAFAAVLLSAAPAEPPAALTPYQIKVGLLYNFAIYTEWPKAAFVDGSAPFVFGVLGTDPFGADLDFLKRKPIKGRSVVVKPLQKAEDRRHIWTAGRFLSAPRRCHRGRRRPSSSSSWRAASAAFRR